MKTLFDKEPSPRFNPLDDYLFMKVMGQKGDEIQLLGFLNAVLRRSGKDQLNSVEILENKALPKDTTTGKSCVLDVLAVLEDGTRVNIEVQLRNEYNMDRRSLFYLGKVFTLSLPRGQDYGELPNVIAINIVDFKFPPGGGLHTCFHLREDSDPSLVITALEIHFISMLQWRKLKDKDIHNDPLHRWLAWFDIKSPPELVEEVMGMEGATAAAYKALEEAMKDEDDYRSYWAQRKAEHDRVSQLNSARREGLAQGIGEVARKLKAMGESIERICEITGLSPEAVEKL